MRRWSLPPSGCWSLVRLCSQHQCATWQPAHLVGSCVPARLASSRASCSTPVSCSSGTGLAPMLSSRALLSQQPCAGHSLGGALASLAVHSFATAARERGRQLSLSLYTFGAPRTGNHAWAREAGELCQDTWHLINDQVAFLNMALWAGRLHIVWHCGSSCAARLLDNCSAESWHACTGCSASHGQVLGAVQEGRKSGNHQPARRLPRAPQPPGGFPAPDASR